MSTKHEGNILYWKLWNFWVRAGTKADLRSDRFFRDYESANTDTDALLRDVGFPWRKTETEEEVWSRIGMESFDSVDYQHPFKIVPVPPSGFERVPYLPD